MRSAKDSILKRFMLWLMVMLMLTGTVPAGYVETVQAETTVYITPTGAKYHTHKCGNGNYYPASLSTAKARGLEPCKKCFGSSYSSSAGESGGKTKSFSVEVVGDEPEEDVPESLIGE